MALGEDSFAYVNAITIQNLTLKHYNRYETHALKNTVLAMEDLQLNTSGSTLVAIRKKYNQEKIFWVIVPEDSVAYEGFDEATEQYVPMQNLARTCM
ncbi:unnamed protein product [Brassica oleracea var. botrytis]